VVLVATADLVLAGMWAVLLLMVMASPNVLLGFLPLFDLAVLSVFTGLSALVDLSPKMCEHGLPSYLEAMTTVAKIAAS
jgi:hypothetical protein